ncbi:MAG: DNA-directed RNA polymerase subunit beta' [Deltaproteobacteria bacterium TMED58]|nr:DNA-directed RNA polymerase subunit beta' [Deltaproteobacteria bacterium TMED58]
MIDMGVLFDKPKNPGDIDSIRISIASPEQIKDWSYGEIKKPETINYRTFKPEKYGLFCCKIFGPVKDFECLCGKYKRLKHRGITCEKCGVEVISSKVRRSRMAHVELSSPVAHIWFLKSVPSRIGSILDITLKDLEKVLYFEAYVVTDPGDSDLKKGTVITEEQYRTYIDDNFFLLVGMGAEAIRSMLEEVNLEELSSQLKDELKATSSPLKRVKISKRLRVAESFRNSGNRPEWMILKRLPVLPPDLRPLVPLDGGRFATSDLNDLYRRVINRNNRLKKLMELGAPDIIVRNEKRMLQESVDALFENGRRGRPVLGHNHRPLKSLSDIIKGKQGRFRQNLLGKRVDYSGRSVIVVGPQLKLHQCGLPKKMALELFRPFIYQKLELWNHAATIKIAKNLVEQQAPIVWDALDDVIKEHPVMLNRAPTLHRLSIQAFEPVLVEDKAIQLHPLVCPAFNADFDGDQMAVHVPLSVEAQTECRTLVMSTNNILSPAHGKPVILPSQDIVLGIYYMSREVPGLPGEGKAFSSIEELRFAFDLNEIAIHTKIRIKINGVLEDTTVGRALIFEVMPNEVPFHLVNRLMTKKAIEDLIDTTFRVSGGKSTVLLADRLRTLGFKHSTTSGISVSISDMTIPSEKDDLLNEANTNVKNIQDQYLQGLITDGERYNKVIDVWARTGDSIGDILMGKISESKELKSGAKQPSNNPIFMMVESGARGSQSQVRQLAGMRGLMAKPSGDIIETPITSNFREGLSVLQYFISTHGARKGLADTALKTANAGYLTRRLVDVAQEMMVMEFDCGTSEGLEVSQLVEGGEVVASVGERTLGRILSEDVLDPLNGELIASRNQEVDESIAKKIDSIPGSLRVNIRSVLTCTTKSGCCSLCYGRNLASGQLVNTGEAVGIIAAQSIGEPGTQLTMRTFHIGGVAKVDQSRHEAKNSGKVRFIDMNFIANKKVNICTSKSAEIVIEDINTSLELERYPITIGAKIYANDGDKIKAGQLLAEWDPTIYPFIAEEEGHIEYKDLEPNISYKETVDQFTGLSVREVIQYKDQKLNPALVLVGKNGNRVEYPLPKGSEIRKDEREKVEPGDFIATLANQKTQTKDITGGLPRVAELFEARPPKDPAVISEIEGVVSFGKDIKSKKRIIVTPDVGDPKEYMVPKAKHILVREGERIVSGDQIVDGAPDPHDILKIKGEIELARYIVDEIQDVYRLQGVRINDKHIEVIARQMLKRVKIVDSGDTTMLVGEAVDKNEFILANEKIIAENGNPAQAEPLLLGITRASLSTKSWLSAASFQETTKVLTDASCEGRVDNLNGLKENVIMGRLIPAGTGLPIYSNVDVEVNAPEIETPPSST